MESKVQFASNSPNLYERNATLDTIRGFSLLGILLVNVIGFYTPLPHIMLEFWFTNAKDIIWHQTLDIYVQGSFYPLFAMLFGYGIAMQYDKAQQAGRNFYLFVPKRLLGLFVLGVLHAVLIWWGDILVMYAFCGLFLLGVIRFKPIVILAIGLVLNGIAHTLILSSMYSRGAFGVVIEKPALDIIGIQDLITAYGTGTWVDAFMQRLTDLTVQMSFDMFFTSIFTILPFILIGAAFGKWHIVEKAKELKILWIVLAVIFVAGGLLLKSAPYQLDYTYPLAYAKSYIGGPMLAFGYMALITSLCLMKPIQKLLNPFAKMGRMSLTMYLMQSVICSVLFYNFGFGLFGKVDVLTGIFIAIGIFVAQIILAELWLMKFNQGPVEALMKKIVYGKKLSEK